MSNSITQPLWWQRGVVYQIYPRSFKDSNADGIGDLAGIIEKLDYLSETLGIDAIWLSPFYKSPMADFGYDVSDYTAVDPIFGDIQTFDRLVAEAHKRDIQIIVDFVPNHTSDQHPWFVESRSSRDNPKRTWYTWADGKPGRFPPNNWQSVFGGSAWQWDEKTGQYYLHSFLSEQPDLNWRNPEVKAAMLDAVRFWLEHGVDGFRIDVAHYIMKDPDLRDNPPNPNAASTAYKSLGEYDQFLHLFDFGHEDIHGVLREFRQLLNQFSTERPRYSVGEIHIFDWTKWATYYGTNLDELHMPFNFALIGAAWQAPVVRKAIAEVEAALPPGAWPNYVLSNHDEHRIVSRIGAESARQAMLLLLTLRGTPTMYYGDELAMHDVVIPPEREQDPWGKRVKGLGLGRDPERTPMQWDESPNAGFSTAGVQTWLPIAEDYASVNVAAELRDPDSMLNLTRALLKLRRNTEALHSGSLRLLSTPENALAYVRESESEKVLIALNFGSAQVDVSLPELGTGQIVLSTHKGHEGALNLASLRLAANEGCIIRLN